MTPTTSSASSRRNRGATRRIRSSARRTSRSDSYKRARSRAWPARSATMRASASVSPSSGVCRSKTNPIDPMRPPRRATAARAHARRSPATSQRCRDTSGEVTRGPRRRRRTRFLPPPSSASRPSARDGSRPARRGRGPRRRWRTPRRRRARARPRSPKGCRPNATRPPRRRPRTTLRLRARA